MKTKLGDMSVIYCQNDLETVHRLLCEGANDT